MNHSLKLLIAASSLSLLAACGNNSSGTDMAATGKSAATSAEKSVAPSAPAALALTSAVDAFRPAASTTAAQDSPMKSRDLSAAPVPANVNLGAPLASQTTAARQSNAAVAADHMGKPLQIGFGRAVAQTATASGTSQVLKWQATKSGGQVAAINFNSAGAKGMRVGLLVTQLPATATLRFYAKGAATAFEVKGADVLSVLAKNLAAGDKTDEGRTYWAPAVDGADTTVEIELPAGESTGAVAVSIPSISHIFMSNKEISTATAQINYTGDTNAGLSCQVDVKCSSPIPAATDAVVHLRFNKDGGTYVCSGTMLNDSIYSATPYLLTANHCISDQTIASTLTTWFKYRSLTCNNGSTGEYYPVTGGAELLYTAYSTDTTFVKLNTTPNVSGILYAGWDATTAPAVNTNVHSVHHPQGDQQRLSRGAITNYSVRDATNVNSFYGSNVTSGTILDVTITTGLTEGGSSGSGLFKGTDSNPQVIGQLYGGSAPACGSPKYNVYGRFDVAYNAGMSDSLSPRSNVYRFYNNLRGTHFLSTNVAEKNFIAANYPQFSFEGPAFKAETMLKANTSPVYRFYNSQTQSHFFTIEASERDSINAKIASGAWPQFTFEGTSWYAKTTTQFGTAPDGTIPLHRFYRTNGTHFYTTNTAEKNSIQANLSAYYTYEGIAYYVWP